MPNELAELQKVAKETSEGLASLTKGMSGLVETLKTQRASDQPHPSQVFGGTHVRTGENPMSSRGFSFMKMLGLITGAVKPENAKIELDVHRRLDQCYGNGAAGSNGYNYGGGHRPGEKAFMAPLSTAFMQEEVVPIAFRHEMKSLVNAGVDGSSVEEMRWIRQQQAKSLGYSGQKTLSWLNENLGGGIVAPPEMGELIELLRNKEALVNAGARTVPLPPQGRIRYPRQTMASTTRWVGENSPITASDIGTGDVSLQAKKLAVIIQAPNELLRFASPAAEALMRDDMTKSLALGLDLAGLEGAGGDTQPLGIILRPGINTVISSSPTATGDALVGQDIYRMVAAVEESNAEFEGWIMRPKTWFKYLQLRASAVAQGDSEGMFLFNAIREPGEGSKPSLATYPVTKSTQVSQVQSKGGGAANLTYILGGMFSDVLIGMFGAIEFSATTLGDTAFINDQTWVKGILSADVAIRHEAALCYMSSLVV